MSYFTEQDARSIIRNAYGGVQSDDTKVAASIYEAEEIAGLPRSAVTLSLGVGHPVRHAGLKPLHAEALRLLDGFERYDLRHVPREENALADEMSNRAIDEEMR